MLITSIVATAVTLGVYCALTPRNWGLRTKLSHRAMLVDMGIGVAMLVVWGVVCMLALQFQLGDSYEPGPPSAAELLPYDLSRR